MNNNIRILVSRVCNLPWHKCLVRIVEDKKVTETHDEEIIFSYLCI